MTASDLLPMPFSNQKRRVFVIAEYYLPGYKAGGAIRSVANLVDCLSDQFDFWILTRDRDATETAAYSNVNINTWTELGKAKVYYASPDSLSRNSILQLIREVKPDVYYLNSFFSYLTIKVLLSRRLGMLPESPVILAPRGEFSPGALRLKKTKKEIYISLASRLGLYDDITWQVASAQEESEVYAGWRRGINSYIAPDLPQLNMDFRSPPSARPAKEAGHVKLAFLSRITRKKNLAWALRLLRSLSGYIEFDIYGPPEDRAYWRECEQCIADLPENIRVKFHGPIPNNEVGNTLQRYHFFFFPTLGESFGHVIFDALAAGCPAIISDTTPWQDLFLKEAGWSLPLEDELLWRRVLQKCVEMDGATYKPMSLRAREYALDFVHTSGIIQLNLNLFLSVLNGSRKKADHHSHLAP